MQRYEYKVIPAPTKGLKAKGIKGPDGRFARAVETTLNEMGNAGWTYLRADILPSEERQGFTSSTTVYRTLLVFQRPLDDAPTPSIAEPAEDAETAAEPNAGPGTPDTGETAGDDATPGDDTDQDDRSPD